MSHRTQDLPPRTGFSHFIRELRYHELSRQLFAVVLIAVFAITATPVRALAFVGLPLAFIGMLIRLHASGYVLKNKELAREGPYALMRHPLYTGNIALVTGFALAGSNWWALPLSALFFWFYYPPAIEYEDRKLAGIFADEWEAWAQQTPALLPRVSNIAYAFHGTWSLARSTRRNGEIFIALLVIVCMAILMRRAGFF
ncbi:MAG TPA: isoprenylcysteine carboxylmethyltransferase family protein [Gammaproteobacteria bacterium]|nr:isoprenylcysteine carboxylmethyltransferase family protein [Gammaproteobacteria bacterium]